MTDQHTPDTNPAWTPQVAWRVYACATCGAESDHQTNHTGRIYNTRCAGSCRKITNPHTARERVGGAYTTHVFLRDRYPEEPEFFGTVERLDASAHCRRADGKWASPQDRVSFRDAFGGLHPRDVGKRIYKRAGVFQMENDQQRDARLGVMCAPGLNSFPKAIAP